MGLPYIYSTKDFKAKKTNLHAIRSGGLSGAQIKKIKAEVVKSDPTLTSTGKKLIQKTLTHLSGNGASQNKPGQFIYKRNINPNVRNHNEHAITSIAHQATDVVIQKSGGETIKTVRGQRADNISVSAHAASLKKPNDGATPTKKNINPNFNTLN